MQQPLRSFLLPFFVMLLSVFASSAYAQTTVTGSSPIRNAINVLQSSPVSITFSNFTNGIDAFNSLSVWSQQSGKTKFGSTTANGNTLTFTPANSFKPGETVFTTVTTASGLASPYVYQFTTASAPAPGTFPKRIDYTTPNGHDAVATADIDGDGKLDIVTVQGSKVTVLKNNGSGFDAATVFATAYSPYDMAVGDVNGDGKLDIVTANVIDPYISNVSVLINTSTVGTVSFDTHVEYSIIGKHMPRSVVLGDVNGDGWLDIVTANDPEGRAGSEGNISVLINSGTGTFPTHTEYPAHFTPVGVALGDVDGDGKLDIVAANAFSSDVSVLINSAINPGTFGAATNFGVGKSIYALALGDVDGDGKLDIVTADYGNGQVSVLKNNTTSNTLSFNVANSYAVGSNTQYVALGDVDGDGKLDIVAANLNSNNVSVLINLGSFSFGAATNYDVGTSPRKLAIGDVDDDGDLDFVAANHNSNYASVLINKVTPPTISSFSPTSGPVGTSITITGTNFTGATGVTFNGIPATSFTVNSATQITATVPKGATTGDVVVTNVGGSSTGVSFTVFPQPIITSLSPASGAVGTSVTITGTNFTGATDVRFNGYQAKSFAVNASGTQITTTVPSGATTGNVVVTTPGGSNGSLSFTVFVAPFITSISPNSGPAGTSTTITGTNFGAGSTVTIGGVNASITSSSPTQIIATVPNNLSSGANPVIVTDNNLASFSVDFTVSPPPTITSLSPTSGGAGTIVTITGTNFTGAIGVTFNDIATDYTVNSSTQITATVPAGATFGLDATTDDVVVINEYETSNALPFTAIAAPPAITSISPKGGWIGASVTITGTNFYGASDVKFNGKPANFIVNSATQITATVPAGATSGIVTITTPDGINDYIANPDGAWFDVTRLPIIASISPISGTVGRAVTITGTNFTGTTVVMFDNLSASFTVNSATQITATVPAGAYFQGWVQLTNSDGTGNLFSYMFGTVAPTISSFSPTSGPVGTSVTITGTDFTGATGVTFNGTAATTYTVKSATQITATVPSGATTGNIVVTTPNGSSTGVSFTVLVSPSIVFTSITKTYGDPSFNVSATSNSSGAITYAVVSGTGATVTPTGTVTITAPGSVVIMASQAADGNYSAGEINSTLTISQAPNTITFTNPGTKTYGDAAFDLTAAATSGSAITFSVVSGPATINGSTLTITSAGDVTIKAASGSTTNYEAATDQSVTFTVNKATASISFSGLTPTYDGSPKAVTATTTPTGLSGVTVKYDGNTTAPTNANSYTVSATLTNDNYKLATGSNPAMATLVIAKATPTITLTVGNAPTYDGTAHYVQSATVSGVGSTSLGNAAVAYKQGSTTVAAPANAGDYAVTASYDATTNYNVAIPVTGTLTISTRHITVKANDQTKTYGEALALGTGSTEFTIDPLTPMVSGESIASVTLSSTGAAATASVAGSTYPITASNAMGSGMDNYTISYTGGKLAVTAKAITVTPNSGQFKIYGDTDPALQFKTDVALVNGDSFTGTLARATGSNVGTYAISQGTLALSTNYNLTFSTTAVNFEIKTKPITITADIQSKVYGDADPVLTAQVTSGSIVGSDQPTGSLTRVSGENVNSYAINKGTYTYGSNYNETYAGNNLTITPRSLVINVTAGQKKVYGQADPVYAYSLGDPTSLASIAVTDVFSGALTRDAGENVGSTYNIPGTGLTIVRYGTATDVSSNYAITYNGAAFETTKRPITVTVNANQSKVYDQSDPTFTYSYTPTTHLASPEAGLAFSDTFSGALSRATGGTNENVGAYTINLGTLAIKAGGTDVSGNYAINFVNTNTFSITQRPITITVIANQTKVYGTQDPLFGYAITNGTLASGDAIGGALTRAAGDGVGNYNILQNGLTIIKTGTTNPDLSSNYNITFVNTNQFAITKAVLQVLVKTPPYSVQYSDLLPPFDYTITGFKFSDKASVVSGAVTYTTTATLASNNTIASKPGSYDVTAVIDKLTAANYTFQASTATGGLTVSQEDANVTYSGLPYFSTTSSSPYTAKVTLSATIKDITAVTGDPNYDTYPGNITNATVTFHRDSPTGTILGTANVPVVLVGTDPKIGAASMTFNYVLSGSEVNTYGTSLPVYAVVGEGNSGYYTGGTGTGVIPGVVTISIPGNQSVNGGGYVKNTNSIGTYAGTAGANTNFGFTMQWTKSGSNEKGQANIIIRSNNRTYQIKSNAINSLSNGTTTKTGTPASFTTKANLNDVTNPSYPVTVASNLDLFVNMNDSSNSGQGDQISILLQSGSKILFSSNWNGSKTALQKLDGGNVQVKNSTTTSIVLTNQAVTMNTVVPEVRDAKFGLTAFPNPTQDQFKLHVESSNRNDKILLRVFDAYGRTVRLIRDVTAGQTITLGNEYRPGIYYVEMIQGKARTQVKLLKVVY